MKDELEDVILDGIALVPDDPNRWLIPRSMTKFDSVNDWWDSLVDNRLLNDSIDRKRIETLKDLMYEYEALQSEANQGVSTVPHQAKIRAVIRQITQSGMTIHQTSKLLGITESRVIGELYCNQTLDASDIAERVIVEHMIREGEPMNRILDRVSMTESQVYSFANMIGCTVTPTPAVNSRKPAEARDVAIQMKQQGHSNIEISQHLLSQGYEILPATISQWWNRHNKKGNNQ